MPDPENADVFALVTVGRSGLVVTIGFESALAAWKYALRRGVAHRARPARIDFDSYLSGRTAAGSTVASPVEVPSGPLPALLRAAIVGWWLRRASWAASI